MSTVSLGSSAAVATAIRRSRKPADEGAGHEFEYAHRSSNGRRFEIREFADGQFFMSELRPNGRGRLNGRFRGVEALMRAMDDPNGFVAAARAAGVEEDGIVRGGSGLGVATRYFETIEAVVQAIQWSLATNEWYDSTDRQLLADPAFKAGLAGDAERDREAYEAKRQADHRQAVAEGQGIFKGLHSVMGPLSKDRRDNILAYLNAPTEEGWSEIAKYCVKGFKTLWQAWIAVEPSAPRSLPDGGRWPRIPDAETLRAAMREVAGLGPDERPDGDAEIVSLRR